MHRKTNLRESSLWTTAFVLLGLIVLAGCSDSGPAVKTEPAKTPPRETVPPTDRQDGLPRSPEATLREMVEGLKANRPVVVWEAMPSRFQRDINELVRDFANKMDPVLWGQSFATWEKLARLLAEKKTAILSLPELENLTPAARRRLEQHWDGLVELLAILVHSELRDLEKLQSFDMGRFLEKTGGRWLSQLGSLSESLGQNSLSGMLAGLEPKTLGLEEDKAIIGWIASGSEVPVSRFSMIRVEGRWIPAGWGPAWEQIRAWKTRLAKTPAESFRRQSAEKLPSLRRAEHVIDQLLATKTSEEFHQKLTEELGEPTVQQLAMLIGLFGGETPAVGESETPADVPPADAGTVTLIIAGATQEDEDRIFEALAAAVPGDVEVQFDEIRTGLKVILSPVADVDQLANRLNLGTITKTHPAERLIHIDMKK